MPVEVSGMFYSTSEIVKIKGVTRQAVNDYAKWHEWDKVLKGYWRAEDVKPYLESQKQKQVSRDDAAVDYY